MIDCYVKITDIFFIVNLKNVNIGNFQNSQILEK